MEWFIGEDAYNAVSFLTPKDWISEKTMVFKNTDTFIINQAIQRPSTLNEDSCVRIRNIVMKKITEMFPEPLWQNIVFLCFGKSDAITKEWFVIRDSVGK